MNGHVRPWAIGALLLVVPLPVTAQQVGPADRAELAGQAEPGQDVEAAGEEPPHFAEEVTVTVTARKREENLQSVPFSVVAPTQQTLRNRGAESIEDVSANVAGFSVQNLGPGQSQIAMRGVSAGQIVRDQPGVKEQVGVYLDESVISLSLFTPDLDLFDMSRIEVLRGPQGTLFGSGSLSGTVRYITNQPALGVTEGVGELGFSSLGGGGLGNNAKFAVNVPLGPAAAARVTAYNTAIGGFIDAVQPDLSIRENVDSGRRTGARVALRVQPNDRFAFTPRIIYQDVAMDGWNRIDAYNILANPFTTTRSAVTLGEREQFTQIDEPYTDRFLLGDFTLEYDFGGAALTSITSLTNRNVQVVRDASALGGSVAFSPFGVPEAAYSLDFPLVDATTAKGVTQEFRVAGVGERADWVLGAFYSGRRRVGYRGGAAPADHTPLPDRGGGHLALAGRRRLGGLRQRHLPVRRLPLHAGGRPGRGLRRGQTDGAVSGPAPGRVHRRPADAEHVHVQSGAAGLQHPQYADWLSQRPLGRRLLRRQRDRRAGLPGPRPGARHAGPGRLLDEPAAELRRQYAHRLLTPPVHRPSRAPPVARAVPARGFPRPAVLR